MANYCGFCDTHRPPATEGYEYGTRLMMLGHDWFEFCQPCGKKIEVTNSKTNETLTLHDLSESLKEKRDERKTQTHSR